MKGYLEGILSRFTAVSQGAIYLTEFFEIEPRIVQSKDVSPFPKPIKYGFLLRMWDSSTINLRNGQTGI